MKFSIYKFKDIVKDTIASIKRVNYRVVIFSFIILALIGIVIMAISLFSPLVYLVPLVFALLCFCISPVMELYASNHLNIKVKYPLLQGCVTTTYGYYHLVMSFIKAFFFGTFIAMGISLIMFSIANVSHPEVLQEILNLVDSTLNEVPPGLVIVVSPLTNNLLITYNLLNIISVFIIFFICHRKNELGNAYSSAYMNKDKRFFLFNPLKKNVFNLIYRRFRINYRLTTWWSTLIFIVIFVSTLVGGTFIGLSIKNVMDSINPYYFGLGFSLIFFGLWYGIERSIDSTYINHYIYEIERTIPTPLLAQLASVAAVYQQGFPNGRFNPNTFPQLQTNQSRSVTFGEDTLKKYFFLYYSSNVSNTEYVLKDDENVIFTVLDEEKHEEVKEEKPVETKSDDESPKIVGVFGIDDFEDKDNN